jgi:tRNA/tmRNA/rRNA uracil-C5-methylase (TrmA/RlmC/RlmD family)
MATGECMKRPEVVAAIARLKGADQSPFAPDSGFPFVTGPTGTDRLKMKLTAEQKYEMCTLYIEFPGQKQETIGKCYGLERSTISKILKDKRRWLATDAAEYAASQQKEGSKNGSPLKPTSK